MSPPPAPDITGFSLESTSDFDFEWKCVYRSTFISDSTTSTGTVWVEKCCKRNSGETGANRAQGEPGGAAKGAD